MAEATELYRMFDKNKTLLYVGITMQAAGARLERHSQTKSWWPLVTSIVIQRRPTTLYGGFERDECEAILNEFPMFNVRGVPWRERRPRSGDTTCDELRNRAEIAGAVARLDDAGVAGRLALHEWAEPLGARRRFLERRQPRERLVYLEDLYYQRALGEFKWQRLCASGEVERIWAEIRAEDEAEAQSAADRGGDG